MGHALPKARNVILVAEEDADTTRLLRSILRRANARIVATRSGARALTIAADNPIDLVILGVKFADIRGTTLLRRLRAINADVPVLIATSHGSADTVREAMELGVVDYLTKPFDRGEMLAAVQAALAARARLSAGADDADVTALP